MRWLGCLLACGRLWCGSVFVVVLLCWGGSVTAVSWAGEACSNEQLRAEQPYGSGLPDCRAYEMVSPLEKDDNGVTFMDSRASVAGDAMTYVSIGAFASPRSTQLEGRYLARRGADGWSTQNISPPYTEYRGIPLHNPSFGELLFTPELTSGITESVDTPLLPGEPVGYVNLYLANTETGGYQAVTTVTPEAEYPPFAEKSYDSVPQAEGASSDLSHVVFQHEASLCCGASRGGGLDGHAFSHIYEWAAGQLYQVDVPPAGEAFDGANVGSTADFFVPATHGDPWHAVSADGSRVVFTGAEPGQEVYGQVYVRENPTSPAEDCEISVEACTVEVSRSQREPVDPNSEYEGAGGKMVHRPAFYRDASSDGRLVFFTSVAELTNDANTGSPEACKGAPEPSQQLGDCSANLYVYDLGTGKLTDLSVDPGEAAGAGVQGLVNAGEDGSYVYFVADGVLSEAANSEGVKAQPGNCRNQGELAKAGKRTCNLYVIHYSSGSWEPPRFIARLDGADSDFAREDLEEDYDEADWIGDETEVRDYGPGLHTARVTPDGTELAFESERRLTAYENEPAQPDDCVTHEGSATPRETSPCREVYLYDAQTGKLLCASCDPSGARPAGPAELGGQEVALESVSEVQPYYLPRNLSENGGRLFFQSPDALAPHDSNGLLDVYEWERPASPAEAAEGSNSCTTSSPEYSPTDEGCILPISDVAGGQESHFMDASPDGTNVFIATADQLVPADTDTRADVYDVRVNGGFPVATPPPACTNGDSCKLPAAAQPTIFAAPASAAFSGPGNPAPPPAPAPAKNATKKAKCKRGYLRGKNGRCVRKHGKKRASPADKHQRTR